MFHLLTPRAEARALSGAVLSIAMPLVVLTSAALGMVSFQAWRNGQAETASRGQAFAGAAQAGYATAAAHPAPPPALRVSRAARPRDLDCLASAVYYEARGESAAGQAAVAQVVLNRIHHPAYPKSVCGVVFQSAADRGCQFSFVCDGAMGQPRDAFAWRRARLVAGHALQGYVMQTVGAAISFHASPAGLIGPLGAVAKVGGHVFFDDRRRPARVAPTVQASLSGPEAARVADTATSVASARDSVPTDAEHTTAVGSE